MTTPPFVRARRGAPPARSTGARGSCCGAWTATRTRPSASASCDPVALVSAGLAAPQPLAVPPGRGRRGARRRHGRAAPHAVRRGPRPAPLRGDPQLGAARRSSPTTPVAAVGRLRRRSRVDGRTVVLYLGNTGVGHGFGTVLDAAARLDRRGALPVRRRRCPVGRPRSGRWPPAGSRNVVLRGYVPKDDTPAVMAGADLALITLDDRSLGVMSPSKLHANLAAGLPVLYVGPEGSNVDEAIRATTSGAASAHGDVTGVVEAVRELAADDDGSHAGPSGLRGPPTATPPTLPAFDRVLDGALRLGSRPARPGRTRRPARRRATRPRRARVAPASRG